MIGIAISVLLFAVAIVMTEPTKRTKQTWRGILRFMVRSTAGYTMLAALSWASAMRWATSATSMVGVGVSLAALGVAIYFTVEAVRRASLARRTFAAYGALRASAAGSRVAGKCLSG